MRWLRTIRALGQAVQRPEESMPIESTAMRRWFFIWLVLLVLPLQQVWAAAAPYCAHEATTGAMAHLGHHEHQHISGGAVTAIGDDAAEATGAYHADCGTCHLGACAAWPMQASGMATPTREAHAAFPLPRYRSHTPDGPDRPQIVHPHLAARFAGSVGDGVSALA